MDVDVSSSSTSNSHGRFSSNTETPSTTSTTVVENGKGFKHVKSSWEFMHLFPKQVSRFHRMQKVAVFAFVGLFSKYIIGTSRYNTHGFEKWDELHKRHLKERLPLITVSNHSSIFDDPILWGNLSFFKHLLRPHHMRWILGAEEVCFSNSFTARFFSSGQVIPVRRGAGVYQESMDHAIECLRDGGWVHVFPEGKINQSSDLIRFKWGIGRLVDQATTTLRGTPLVLPVIHRGMEHVAPEGQLYYPRPYRDVSVLFGNPIDFGNILKSHRTAGSDDISIRKNVTDIVQESMERLHRDMNKLHPKS